MVSKEERELLDRYAAVEVPPQLKTGELDSDPIVGEAQRHFIASVADALQLGRAGTFLLDVTVSPLLPAGEEHLPPEQRHYMTDDYLTRLRLNGVQTLASIEKNRTDYNFMVVQFAKHDLGERAIHTVLRYHERMED